MKTYLLALLSALILSGCSLSPRSGSELEAGEPVDFYMIVPHLTDATDELWIRWQAANVDSQGNILNWETLAFWTRYFSSEPFTLFNGEEYRSYTASESFYHWTEANTGYTGGCGNVPNSCPTHGLIRAQIRYNNGILPAYVYPQDMSCITQHMAEGGRSVIDNCAIEDADGIVVVFPAD